MTTYLAGAESGDTPSTVAMHELHSAKPISLKLIRYFDVTTHPIYLPVLSTNLAPSTRLFPLAVVSR
jgi:hypothetical protein